MASKFQDCVYREVSLYNHFVDEWSADEKLPLQRLPRFEKLVYPNWLKQLLAGESARVLRSAPHLDRDRSTDQPYNGRNAE